ncbi:MAG: glycoside hydrolase family 32 protein [Chloroflexota bacterium]
MSFSLHDEKMNRKIRSAEARASADPRRPVFHFHAPAQWMNDPNGTIYFQGYYHVFYQFNPFGDSWDHLHWGHAMSRDLLHWEYLPIALYPEASIHEEHCFSGCATLDRDGHPMLFYTSVPFDVDNNPHMQRAAVGDQDMLNWTRLEKAVLTVHSPPGTPRIKNDWRDPYIYRKGSTYYLVLSAVRDDDTPVVLLYTNTCGDLTRWDYRTVLKSFPKGGQLFECPNFFQMQGAWILIGSPFEPVQYFTGSFDEEQLIFIPMKQGLIDHSSEFYASNTVLRPADDVYLLAWIRAFPKGRGWNGCLALPRALRLSDRGGLLQTPVPELKKLRGAHYGLGDCTVEPHGLRFQSTAIRNCEILLRADLTLASKLDLSAVVKGTSLSLISLEASLFHVQSTPVQCKGLPPDSMRQVDIRLFIDRSVLEVFIDAGRLCVSHMVESLYMTDALELRWNNSVHLLGFDVWEMQPLTYSVHPSLVQQTHVPST